MSRAPIYLITAMCALNHSGFGGSRVAISLYALELGVSQFMVGILMALYALSPMLLAVTIGRFADRVGPRLPMLAASLGTAFGYMPVFLCNTALLIGAGELIRRGLRDPARS